MSAKPSMLCRLGVHLWDYGYGSLLWPMKKCRLCGVRRDAW